MPRLHSALLLALASAIAFFSACSRRETLVQAGDRQGILHIGNGAEVQYLDPHLAGGAIDHNVLSSLFEGLVTLDEETLQPRPGMAARWEMSSDGLIYTFHLRPDARWSNGDPFTTRDFLYSFRRALTPALASEYAYMLFPLRGAEAFNAGATTDFAPVGATAPDDRTLVVELAAPTPYFLGLVAHQAWFPVHPPTILRFGKIDQRGTAWTRPENHVGNGPYRLATWVPNDRIEVVRAALHYSDPAVGPRRVIFFPTDNTAADESAYRAGQRHVTYDLLPDRIATYRAQSPSPLRIDPQLETAYLRFNTTRPPLTDARVRRALALAVDRDALADSVLLGSRLPANHFVPPGLGASRSPPGQIRDVTAARALLTEAGFPDGKGFPRLELLTNTDPVNTRILEAIQAMWKRELGIDVALVSQDFRVYLDTLKGLRYDIARSRWVGDYNDPNTFLDMCVTAGGNNQTGWSVPAYDQLIAAAAHTPTQTERLALLQQAETLLLTEAPIAPLYFGARVHLLHPDVTDWHGSLLGVRRYQTLRLAPAGP